MVVIEFMRYKLVNDSKLVEFINVQKKVLEIFAKKQKGFICWESCLDHKQNTRADILHWETLEDLMRAREKFVEFDECKEMMDYVSQGSIETFNFNSVTTWNRF
jgi:hypothetical protein